MEGEEEGRGGKRCGPIVPCAAFPPTGCVLPFPNISPPPHHPITQSQASGCPQHAHRGRWPGLCPQNSQPTSSFPLLFFLLPGHHPSLSSLGHPSAPLRLSDAWKGRRKTAGDRTGAPLAGKLERMRDAVVVQAAKERPTIELRERRVMRVDESTCMRIGASPLWEVEASLFSCRSSEERGTDGFPEDRAHGSGTSHGLSPLTCLSHTGSLRLRKACRACACWLYWTKARFWTPTPRTALRSEGKGRGRGRRK